jgi:tetratricopeptide (TPR) repeat protein
MLKQSALLVLAAGLVMSGCAKDGQVNTAMTRNDADKLKNEKIKSEMIEDRPLTADSHFAAGQLAEAQSDVPRALEQYELALKLNPKHAGSLYRMGLIYTAQEQFQPAVETWKKYIEATNNAASGYSNLGLCLEMAGRSGEAEAAFKAGIAREPNGQLCRVNYGLMLARQGRLTEAEQQLQAVLTAAEVHYNLASVFEMQGKKSQAKVEYRKSIELDPDMSDAKARLAALGND